MRTPVLLLTALALATLPLRAQEGKDLDARLKAIEGKLENLHFALDIVRKSADDSLWWLRLSDIAVVDKVTLVGPPNPRGKERYGIKNERHPQRIYQYVFIPRNLDRTRKHPAIVLPRSGVHGDFGTRHVHIVREMLERGYVVLASDYRGSTGYGKAMKEAIDYGGLEVDDVVAGLDWAVAELGVIDAKRVGIVGWSHGGLIALFGAFNHPEKFAVAYAGVPVSDLLTRFGYTEESYMKLFSADYHVGKEPVEAVDEYRRRSPIWHVAKLSIPLMITSTTNDRDVNVVEVEQLIIHLKAAGKSFEHKIYTDAPGGHSFDRIDTTFARGVRKDMYAFLEKYLK